MEEMLEKLCDNLRDQIRDLSFEVHALMNDQDFDGEQTHSGQHAEMKANIMLLYRHIEDARMRLGKVMQQIQGGVSILDRMKDEAVNTGESQG